MKNTRNIHCVGLLDMCVVYVYVGFICCTARCRSTSMQTRVIFAVLDIYVLDICVVFICVGCIYYIARCSSTLMKNTRNIHCVGCICVCCIYMCWMYILYSSLQEHVDDEHA